jgi:hypothetical protein
VPERDGQREETFARFRNGEPELGQPRYRQEGMNSRAFLPVSS